MYHYIQNEQELGFDAFIAPDDFKHDDPDQYGGDHPVDIYEKFIVLFNANPQARYIYSYSDGNYPLTLTPSGTEYYRYGYTYGGTNYEVELPLSSAAKTIWGTSGNTSGSDENTGVNKRWVCVYRPSTVKFGVVNSIDRAVWYYCGTLISAINNPTEGHGLRQLKYIHFANINSISSIAFSGFSYINPTLLSGSVHIPETIYSIPAGSFTGTNISKVFLPQTKKIDVLHTTDDNHNAFAWQNIIVYDIGISTPLVNELNYNNGPTNLKEIYVSSLNSQFSTFNTCDILFSKTKDSLLWVAPKTVRALIIPDTLPQSEVTALGTKLQSNLMQNFPLYIGMLTDLTNLYLGNKKFIKVGCHADNTAFTVENNILYDKNKTTIVKAGTNNTGNLVIQNTVTTLSAGCFNGCTNYTGSLTIGSGITSIPANAFKGLTNMTSLTLPANFNLSVWSAWNFATFTGESLYNAILNCADGTALNPKYFILNQASLDNLNAYTIANSLPNAVTSAALRYINVFISGNKLSLDASNVASYPGSGTTWYDLSGSGNNGTLASGFGFLNENRGVINLTTGTLSCTFSSNIVKNNFSVSFCIKPNSLSNYNQALGLDTLFYWEKYIFHASANSGIYTGTDIGTRFGPIGGILVVNRWDYIHFTYSNGNAVLYRNGIAIASKGMNAPISNFSVFNTFTVNAKFNNVDIYDYALTAAQVAVNFNALKSKYGL